MLHNTLILQQKEYKWERASRLKAEQLRRELDDLVNRSASTETKVNRETTTLSRRTPA